MKFMQFFHKIDEGKGSLDTEFKKQLEADGVPESKIKFLMQEERGFTSPELSKEKIYIQIN